MDGRSSGTEVLRDLDHPNIIRLFEYGEDVAEHKIHLLMAPQRDQLPFHRCLRFPRNLETKSLVRSLLQGLWGSFLEEA